MMEAIVLHSGGMDSSICLRLAIDTHGTNHVHALSFHYNQRNAQELQAAKKICEEWKVKRTELDLSILSQVTRNALTDPSIPLEERPGQPPSSWVVGRHGLMIQIAAIFAHQHQVNALWLGVLERADSNSGYPDCSRDYIDLKEQALRIDLSDTKFSIVTPLIRKTKPETLALAAKLGVLDFLVDETVTCYNGIKSSGCGQCLSCQLRSNGLAQRTKDLMQ